MPGPDRRDHGVDHGQRLVGAGGQNQNAVAEGVGVGKGASVAEMLGPVQGRMDAPGPLDQPVDAGDACATLSRPVAA